MNPDDYGFDYWKGRSWLYRLEGSSSVVGGVGSLTQPCYRIRQQQYMDWQGLQLLLKAPKKKYIKKIVEYAVLIYSSPNAVPNLLNTPISQEFATDLQLSTQQSHQLLTSLLSFLKVARQLQFEQTALRNSLSPHISEQLIQILVDIVGKISYQDIRQRDYQQVNQADRLVDFSWALQMQVASDKGKSNIPVVKLQLNTAKNSSLHQNVIQMKGTQFSVFFKNLQKMKEQLSQLVSTND